jgi:hypothetical protein
LLLLLGTAIVMVFEAPIQPQAEHGATSGELSLQQSQLLNNR